MTSLAGIIGFPLRHTVSPAFQQAAFDHLGLDARYEAWETPPEGLASRVAALRMGAVLGFNVTVPHKERLVPLLDRMEGAAVAIGAVNTVVRDGRRLVGHNTDADAFLRALREDGGLDPAGRRALVLGAGGSARAVCYALLREGVSALAVANRTVERARGLLEGLHTGGAEVEALPLEAAALSMRLRRGGFDLVVNCTPLGMRHGPGEGASPLPAELAPVGCLVCDLVYNPPETPLLQAARAAGARTLGGLPMLVYQGAASFWLWTRIEAPLDVMFRAARRALAGA